MGEVWSASHGRQEADVAVKLLTEEAARDPRYRTAFRNEIRNAARLDHPALVAIYDYGEVSPDEGRASAGRFEVGTPWLAMERVVGDTLLPYCGRVDWRRQRALILSLLGALGHVHAQGVFHRDLKPGNVLLTSAHGQMVVKLSDFGLAHASEAGEEDHFNGGTPAYMAPEQFDGMWRNYGPWTDLYSLGALLFAVCTGAPPFGLSTSFEESRRQHQEDVVPALAPIYPVPAGFESWLRRLLEKDPARRYRRAADAAADFLALGEPVGEDGPPVKARADGETLRLETLSTMTDVADVTREEVRFTVGSSLAKAPPMPSDWRLPEHGRAAGTRVGLSLLGLRTLPLVGREDVRDLLWATLARARAEQRVEVVALHGPLGMGKSRLAHWLGQRGHEVGSAILLRATHGPLPMEGDGLSGMALRFLRCDGLQLPELRRRVDALVGDDEAEGQALLELLAPGEGDVRFGSDSERWFAVEQLLARATAERPVVLRLDDVHYGPDTLRFVRHLLDRPDGGPVVVLLTATDEMLRERVDAAALWQELLTHPHVQDVRIGPLPPLERRTLLHDVLGLEPALADLVGDQTGGAPQLAVQVVQDWVDHHRLVPGPEGFRFRDGFEDPPPWDWAALWERRLDGLLAAVDDDQVVVLELAAVLGRGVEQAVWAEAARHLGLAPTADLVDGLLQAGLVQGTAQTWVFTHPALLAVLRRRARTAGRWRDLHAAAANVFAARMQAGRVEDAERLGRHLVGAGRYEEALQPLLDGLEQRIASGDHTQADGLLQLRLKALDAARLPEQDVRRGENDLARYNLHRRRGELDRAVRVLAELEQRARHFGWDVIGVWTRIYRARMDRLQGELDRVVRTLRDAIEDAVAIGEPKLVAQARAELGDVEAVRGRLDDARKWARGALQDFERLEDVRGQARCWQVLGELDRESGRYGSARQLLDRARSLYASAGYRWGIASALNSEGDVARQVGDLDHAERCYRRSSAVFQAIGSHSAIYPQFNRALTLLARGDVEGAAPAIERGMAHFSQSRDGVGMASAHLALALCAAQVGRWIAWDDHLQQATELLDQLHAADEDTAWLCEVAGGAAATYGESERALHALSLALEAWEVLGRHDRARAVREALRANGGGNPAVEGD